MRLILVLVAALGSTASAGPALSFQISTPAGGRPTLRATIDDAPHVPLERISLSAIDAPGAPRIPATAVRAYADGDEPLALAIVFNAQEIYVGNDGCEIDPDATFPGVLLGLERGLDALGLGKLAPPRSEIAVVTYATGANVQVPLEPLEQFHGSQLGTQADYHDRIGTDLVQGVTVAVRELERSTARRKLLVVIGDGNDTNNAAAQTALAELADRAAGDHLELLALIYKSTVSMEGEVISTMIPRPTTVSSIDGLIAALRTSIDRIADRSYVTFADDRLPWDGRDHQLVVQLDDITLGPVTVRLPALHAATPWWRVWSHQLLIGFAALAILIAGLRFVNREV